MVSIGPPAAAATSGAIPLLARFCGRALGCGPELAGGAAAFFFPDFALADFFLETVLDLDLDFATDFFAFAFDLDLDLDLDFLAMQLLPHQCWQSIGLDLSNKPSSFFQLQQQMARKFDLTVLAVSQKAACRLGSYGHMPRNPSQTPCAPR
ncbi:MAG TPA: hypothetical protein VN838_23980 [Bradyrhizobium sp.]|nr:hypothetical protein [Bradyrhizobium sp.]